MSSELPDQPDDSTAAPAANVERVRVEDEMEQSYIDYAMSVIAGRALPDVRDGLKPVHRRILYAMHSMGVTSGSSHRKSSSVVGETMGDYHPHGDQAIYDTLVNMAQTFTMREPLIDGQGNFGSMDGDPAAAMRYTEARMSPIAEELLADIEKDTVDFQSNYDDRLEEPGVLPAAYPNLLVNGSTGIAVGMSTKIPPHNLEEVIDATIHLIDNPDCDVEDLIHLEESPGPIKGPDFPTGANIVGRNDIHKAYKTGRGRLTVRAEYEVDREEGRIVVSELPYQENKARVVERIAENVNEGKIEGISDLRDESDRDGVRIVIDLKRGANADVVENQLLEHHLESTFGVINLALVDGQPRVLTLKETLAEYVDHRKEVVRRRSQYELDEAEDRAHILEGRLTAVKNADDVIEIVRDADTRDDAKEALREAYDFSEDQADHIVRIQIGSLTSEEVGEIEREYEEVQNRIDRLEEILGDQGELLDVIKDELREIREDYGDERRTKIVEDDGEVTHEDLIPEQDCVVVITDEDYIKRMPVEKFEPQGRGGKGIIGADPKEGDRVNEVFRANSHDYLLCFTNRGKVYRLKTYQVPEMSRTARGNHIRNVIEGIDDGEEITAVVDTEEFSEEKCLTMVTRNGYVKRTCTSDFENIRSTGIIAASLEESDALVDVEVTDGEQDLVIATEGGMTIRFAETEAREMGRNARGVGAIKLQDGDRVAGLVATSGVPASEASGKSSERPSDGRDDRALLTVTENGYGKRTRLDEYRQQSRYGKGLIDIKTEGRNGPVTDVKAVEEGDHLLIMSEHGQIMRIRAADISTVGRNTKGVTIMELEEGDRVASVTVVPDPDE
ncbi:MAG: DNA gyrase subunit A [Halorientalis sp.]